MGFAPVKTKDKDTGKTTYTFSLCFPELLGIFTLIVLGFTWLFIFGVIVGRGYLPEETVPANDQFMPTQQEIASQPPEQILMPATGATTTPQEAQNPAKTLDKQVASPAPKKTASAPKEQVIKAEQLNFFEQLKGKDAGTAQKAPQKAATPKTSSRKQAAKPARSNALAKALRKPAARSKTPDPALATGTEQFEYVFQIAASTEKKAAEKLQDSIRAKGFTTSLATAVLNTTKWYRINVHFVGAPKDLAIFKSKLAVAGYRTLLLKRKTKR